MASPVDVVKTRPAETAGPLAMAVALLIADAFDIDDPATLTAIAIVLSFVPALVTWIATLRGKSA